MSENVGTIYYDVEVNNAPLLKGSAVAEKQLDKTEAVMKRVDKTSENLNTSLSKLSTAFAAVVSARALSSMAGMVQRYQEMSERVQMATSSQEEFNSVQARLLKTANGTYRSLSEAQELYIRTADSLRSMGYSTQAALDVTDSMSYAFVKNATSADRANTAIDALSKSVNTGKVAADQWETITSAIPSVINDIATASGKTAAQVRALGAEGKLTAVQLTEGLRKALDANAAAAAKMSNNLIDASVRAKTALTAVLVGLEGQTGALDKLTNGIIMASDAVLAFGGDSDKLASALAAAEVAGASFAAVMAGRVLTAMGAYAVAQGRALISTLAQAEAAAAAAKANSAAAAVEYNAAKAALAQATASEKAAVGLGHHAFAANELAIASTRMEAATLGVNAAMTAQAAVVTRASMAMTLLSRTMAFLGGPVGVILLAATALYTFASATKSARTETDALNGSLDKLSFNQLDRVALETGSKLADLNVQMRDANKAYADLLISPDRGDPAKLTAARAAVDDVNDRLKEQKNRLDEVAKARENLTKKSAAPESAGPNGAPKTQNDPEAQKAIKNLQDQEALLKVIGVERAKLAALQKLGDNASPAQRIEAEALAASIYKLEQAETAQKAAKKKGESEATAATKKAAAEQKKAIEDNIKQFADLGEQLASVDKSAKELAMDQAQLSLNKYATPQQVQAIRDIAAALYDAKGAKDALAAADPIANEQMRFTQQMAQLKALNDAKGQYRLNDQRYAELAYQAETAHMEQMRVLQEENFKAQSLGNEILLSSIDALGQSATSAISGILAGTGSLQAALSSIANTVLNTVIGAFVQMGVDWIKQQVLMRAAATATTATQVAGTAAVTAAQTAATTTIASTTTAAAATTGAAVAGSMAPAAGLSSIASFGGAAVIGGAALLATMVLAKSFGGGRRSGGAVSPDSVYRVNEGGMPEVFNAGGQQYMIPNQRGEVVSNKNASSGGAGVVNNINIVVNSDGSGSSQAGNSDSTSRQLAETIKSIVVNQIAVESKQGGLIWSQQNGR